MSTPAQAAASRANGQLSNGPRSVEGKAISARNSFKLGITAQSMIIPGEDPADLEQLTAEYHETFQPVGPVESSFLENAIRAHWMRNRYYRIEAEVIALRASAQPDCEHPVGAAFEKDANSGNTLQKLFRRQQAADRDWRRNLELLEQLQSARRRAEYDKELRDAEAACTTPIASRVRFDNPPQPAPRPPVQPASRHAGEPAANLALRL